MRRALLGLVLVASLVLATPGVAQASPRYGYRWTANHGWIVWNSNDRPFPIYASCHWRASGRRWSTHWYLRAYTGYGWTTSDAGSWGNRRPNYLYCSWVAA